MCSQKGKSVALDEEERQLRGPLIIPLAEKGKRQMGGMLPRSPGVLGPSLKHRWRKVPG